MQELYLDQWDATICWEQVGDGAETIVYLPALGIPARPSLTAVAQDPCLRGTTGILVDLPGTGASGAPAIIDDALEVHTTSVSQLLDHLGRGPCTIVGHSLGGTVAIRLAIRRPDLVSRLIVAEANLTPGGGGTSARVAAMPREEFLQTGMSEMTARLQRSADRGNVVAALFLSGWRQADPRILHASACALVNLPKGLLQDFLSLDLPRCFIYGECTFPGNGAEITPDAPDPARLTDAGVQVEVVTDSGHMMVFENPSGFVTALGAAGVPLRCD